MGKSTGKKGSVSNYPLKKDGSGKFHLKDFVFAKARNYPPWPARIVKYEMESIYKVNFFGVNSYASMHESEMELFNDKTAHFYLKRNQGD